MESKPEARSHFYSESHILKRQPYLQHNLRRVSSATVPIRSNDYSSPFLTTQVTGGGGDILSWTSLDPRESQLFGPSGVLYRFQVRQLIYLRILRILRKHFLLIFRRSSVRMGRTSRRSCETPARKKNNALQSLNGPLTADLVAPLSGRSAWFCHLWYIADSKLINQNVLPMADMVRPDPTVQVCHLLRMRVYKVTNVS